MLRGAVDLKRYHIAGTDGEVGRVKDLLFDDRLWTVRYLVGDSGLWLPGRRVLIPPAMLQKPDWPAHLLPVSLTRKQIKESPGIEEDRPVSRQHEVAMYEYYGWAPYWAGPAGLQFPVVPPDVAGELPPVGEGDDPGLRSLVEVTGYHIAARDGEMGHVEDLIVEDERWQICCAVADTRNWMPGRKVLISPRWIHSVSWSDREAKLDLTREQIRNSPEYRPSEPINREYEERLYDYYGRPKYWT